MIHTRLCDLLEISHPIIQGGMGPNDTSDLAIAVCRAGGLGTLSSSRPGDPYLETRRQIQKVKEQTESTFCVNQAVKSPDAPERIRALLDERRNDPEVRRRLRVVITSAGDPRVYAEALRESGVIHIHVVPTVYHARKAEQAGVQGLIAEGYESGGHVAYEPVHTLVLVPAVARATSLPVVAAGGICDGAGLAACLALGACGVQMGSRFYLSREANFAPAAIKDILFRAREVETTIVPGVYGENRHWRNPFTDRLQAAVRRGATREEIDTMKHEGEAARYAGRPEEAAVPIGMVVGRIEEALSAREIIEGMVAEAERIIAGLQGNVRGKGGG